MAEQNQFIRANTELGPVSVATVQYINESEHARRDRERANRNNLDAYHLRQDYSHKRRGQSREFLAKQQLATDQLASFLSQGLIDVGKWFRVEGSFTDRNLFQGEEIEKLLLRQLHKNDFSAQVWDFLHSAILQSLMIAKVGGIQKETIKFKAAAGEFGSEQRKLMKVSVPTWQLQISQVRPDDYFPDPTGDGLYEIDRLEMDHYKLRRLAEVQGGWDMGAVERIAKGGDDLDRTQNKARETNQNITNSLHRNRVIVFDCWGTILEPTTGKVLHENVNWVVDRDGVVLKKPTPNPFWHQERPYVCAPLLRVPFSVWHRAIMDAATSHNRAQNELFNLMLDAGIMSVFGIKQIREDWLEDPSQIDEGIPAGETLITNSSMPPGAKVLERVDTAQLSNDSVQVFNILDREFQSSAMTNDVRLGNLPERNVKATEIVASNQSLQGVFQGVAKQLEERFLSPLLEKSWKVMAQNMDDLDSAEVKELFGDARSREMALIPKEDRFADSVTGRRYKVFGVSEVINRINDFRKLTSLLQTVGATPELMEQFRQRYSMPKFLGEIVKSLDIDTQKIEASEEELAQAEMDKQQRLAAEQGPPGDQQSQIAQVAGMAGESGTGVEPNKGLLNQGAIGG
jgi:hypothetical protein